MAMPISNSVHHELQTKNHFGNVNADVREILKGAVCADNMHLCVSITPKLTISEFEGYLEGKVIK